MSKKSTHMTFRAPNDLHGAAVQEFQRQRAKTTRVSIGGVLMDWARIGARASGYPIAEVPQDVVMKDIEPVEVKA